MNKHTLLTFCQVTGKPVQNFIRDPKLMEFVKKEFVVNGIKGFGDVQVQDVSLQSHVDLGFYQYGRARKGVDLCTISLLRNHVDIQK